MRAGVTKASVFQSCGVGDAIEENMLANPPDRRALHVPLFQLPNSVTTSFWMETGFVLHTALLLLLKF